MKGKRSMLNNENEIQKYYSLLLGIQEAVEKYDELVEEDTVKKYNKLNQSIYEICKDEIMLDYMIKDDSLNEYVYHSGKLCKVETFRSHINPIIKYLRDTYINEDVSKIGTLYSTIENNELKKRCLDLLSSKDAFDRVINQATQVLEDAIKKKAKLENEKLIGLNLVSKAIAPKKENTILLFSDTPEIQEAYSFLFKGIIGTYRNPTHHSTDYICTREEALKCCAFIDYLLKELNHCKIIEKND